MQESLSEEEIRVSRTCTLALICSSFTPRGAGQARCQGIDRSSNFASVELSPLTRAHISFRPRFLKSRWTEIGVPTFFERDVITDEMEK